MGRNPCHTATDVQVAQCVDVFARAGVAQRAREQLGVADSGVADSGTGTRADAPALAGGQPQGGDAMGEEAADVARLASWRESLVDVLVLSVKGSVSQAHLMSGGDFDGDIVWLCWDERLVRSLEAADDARRALDMAGVIARPPASRATSAGAASASGGVALGPGVGDAAPAPCAPMLEGSMGNAAACGCIGSLRACWRVEDMHAALRGAAAQ